MRKKKELQINYENQIDIYERTLDAKMKNLLLQEKKEQLKMDKIRNTREKSRFALEVIQTLPWLMQGFTIDEERTILGSEPFLIPVFKTEELNKIKRKALEMIAML